jgi:hypothetical protein
MTRYGLQERTIARTLILLIGLLARPQVAGAQLLGAVTQQRDLAFGTVVTGTTTSVAPTAAGAAMWKIHGAVTLGGGLGFTLPVVLTRDGGSETMTITFCSTCAIVRTGNSNPVGGTVFNPNTGTGLLLAVVNDVYVWLGASVTPPLNQKAGTYSGTVVLTVAGLL